MGFTETLYFFILYYMRISIFKTERFQELLFYVRTLNAIVFSSILLPIILYFTTPGVFTDYKTIAQVVMLSLMVFGIPIISIVAMINDNNIKSTFIKTVTTVIFSPTIIVVEPIFRLIYHIGFNRKYRREKLYKMIEEFHYV